MSPMSQPTPRITLDTPHATHDGVLLEIFESIIMALVLALVFRAFIIEPFVIPTGSMAPTLLGQHASIRCPQCGYLVPVGPRNTHIDDGTRLAEPVQTNLQVPCPMCDYTVRHAALPTSAGDRILVLKYNFALAPPQRWDVVVFKNPNEPQVNFIKRLVGLPGEQLWIADGNIYTRPLGDDGAVNDAAPWRIQRKTDREQVQRAAWQPIYNSDYFPLDDGKIGTGSGRDTTWRLPWTSQSAGKTGKWELLRGLRWNWTNTHPALGFGELRFDFSRERDRYNFSPYNLYDPSRGHDDDRDNPVGEMRLAAKVTPRGDRLRIAFDLNGRWLQLRGTIAPDGVVTIETHSPDAVPGAWKERATTKTEPLAVGRASLIELWHADQSASLWINGARVASWEYELEEIGHSLQEARDPAFFEPGAKIELSGAQATLSSIQLDRDLYYTQATRNPGRATFSGQATIPFDHFFCLGDNSPSSEDGRRWKSVDPWVNDQEEHPPGFVPRQLLMGRACFVYYPASHRVPYLPIGIPNFGDMRFIH